jgi:hypothetical protein
MGTICLGFVAGSLALIGTIHLPARDTRIMVLVAASPASCMLPFVVDMIMLYLFATIM